MAHDTQAQVATDVATAADTRLIGHWIDGDVREPVDARTLPVFDPSRGVAIARVALADRDVVDAAVASAARAFPGWRDTPLSRRMPVMYRLRELLIDNVDELARMISAEHGKVVSDAAGEIQRGLEIVELARAAPVMLKGEFSEQVSGGIDTYSLRQPLGVCVGITPFNFPVMVPLWMAPVAIACGNTFVLKPSERDPSASLLLARLAREAGLPPGVLNVVQGDRVAVEALLDHPDVQAVSFVGSTAVARQIYSRAAAAGKRVQALGGAKNHMIVLPDADLGLAADALVSAAFGSTGQRCMAVSVGVAVAPIADALVREVSARVAKLRTGPASEEGVDMGPLVTGEARDRVLSSIDRAVDAGAELVDDGRELASEHADGYFVGPTVVDRAGPGMEVYDDEIFGPVLSIARVDDFDQALALVNESRYGNGAAIFTADGAAARRFQREAQAGMIGVNVPIPVPVGYYSFGGWGDSLFGDTHVYGPEGFSFYTRGKVVTSRWLTGPSGVSLAFPNG